MRNPRGRSARARGARRHSSPSSRSALLALACAAFDALVPGAALAQSEPYDEPAPPASPVAPGADRPSRAPSEPAAPPPTRFTAGPPAAGDEGGLASDVRRVPVRYALEGIEVRGNTLTADRVVLRYVKFRAGDVLDVDDPEIELTRYRLLGTGFFASVQLSLRKGSRRGAAVLVIEIVERNTFVIQNLSLGVAADEDTAGNSEPLSAYLGVEAAETNFAGTGVTLGAGVALAADQLALRTRFVDPALAGTRWSAQASLLYADARDFFGSRAVSFESPELELNEVTDYAVVAFKRFGGTLGLGHDLSVSSDLLLEYRLEQIDALVPVVASHVRGRSDVGGEDMGVREPLDFDVLPGKSVLSTVRVSYSYDTRDSPFLTKKGTQAQAAVTLGLLPLGSSYGYQKLEISAKRFWQLPWKHVVRAEVYAGAIAGGAPFFEKFYVGDFTDLLPDRILGLAPDRRQPPNFLNTAIVEVRYGDFAAKLEGEYRVPVYTGKGSVFGADLFAALGVYGVASRRELTHPPRGYEGFGRVPLDLSYNIGLRVDTKLGGLTVAFSNLLGLIPARRGERK